MVNRPVHFGETLRKYLKEERISIQEFSDAVDIQREYAYALLKKPLFSLELTLRICELYKLPINFFIKVKNKGFSHIHFGDDALEQENGEKEGNSPGSEECRKQVFELMKRIDTQQQEISMLKDKIINMLEGKMQEK